MEHKGTTDYVEIDIDDLLEIIPDRVWFKNILPCIKDYVNKSLGLNHNNIDFLDTEDGKLSILMSDV